MMKTLFRFWGPLAAILVCGNYTPASAQPMRSLDPVLDQLPLQMVRYAEWIQLPTAAQAEVIASWQNFLIQQDAQVRTAVDRSTTQWLFDQWIAEAQAAQQPYCINQGVVRPLDKCDQSLGYGMHDFDTNEDLSKVSAGSKCAEGEKPCSPAFGFASDGNFICSSKNLTRDCKAKSEETGAIPLATVLTSCSKGSPGPAKVNCAALKEFFDQQAETAEKLCANVPKRYACNLLKLQIAKVRAENNGNQTAMARTGTDQPVQALALAAEAAKMAAQKPPCDDAPPKAPANAASAPSTQASGPRAAQASSRECQAIPPPQGASRTSFEKLVLPLIIQKGDSAHCKTVALSDQKSISFKRGSEGAVLEFRNGTQTTSLDTFGIETIGQIAAQSAAEQKLSPEEAMASYFPKAPIKGNDPITVPAEKPGEKPESVPTLGGWTSEKGIQFRYGGINLGDKIAVVVAIKQPGEAKETIHMFESQFKPPQTK